MNFERPLIMGILNLTPDSFSDGGVFCTPELAFERVSQMLLDGADIIDVGAESTGPGSLDVSVEQELARLKPILEKFKAEGLFEKALFSIDTYKHQVAEYALSFGFQIVNDVTALRGDESMIQVLLKYRPYVVLMHSKDPTARTTKEAVEYDDVISSVSDFLLQKKQLLLDVGFPENKIILDPGMGAFISTIPDYSFEIIERLEELKKLNSPLLVGISRKSCLGGKLEDRDKPSAEWSQKAIKNGANIIRIHNVKMMTLV